MVLSFGGVLLFFLNLEFPLKLERKFVDVCRRIREKCSWVSWEVGHGNHWTVIDQLVNRIEGSGDFAINLNVSVLILKC